VDGDMEAALDVVQGDPRRVGEGVAFFVNGGRAIVTAALDTPLLYALRNDLGLKGTRFGCGTGQCGTCMVLIDGHPRPSCDTPLSAMAGRHVTTVEGLADRDRLDPLQQAFVDEGAGQCGYCLSGILMSAAALLESNPDPSDSQIRSALDGNLCRCGAHPRIVRAIKRAAARSQSSPPGEPE
jgi:nicotinate dehydrogenase subunit A